MSIRNDYHNQLTPEQRHRKKHLERRLIILASLGLFLLLLVQRTLLNLGPGLSSNQGVITLVSINISVLILGFLLFLILRGLYRIFFERQTYGSLQTKMVVSFISLSLLPTILIFYFSYRLIGQDHETWFSSSIRETLEDSLSLAETTLELERRVLVLYGSDIAESFQSLNFPVGSAAIGNFLEDNRAKFHLTAVEYYGGDGRLVLQANGGPPGAFPPFYPEWFRDNLGQAWPWEFSADTTAGGLTRLVWPLFSSGSTTPSGYLVIDRLSTDSVRSRVEEVQTGLAKYRAALGIQKPFRVTQLTSLAGVTLLAVFLSIWIGSHLAGSLAGPVTEMVEGTKRVAKGDLDFVLTPVHQSGEMAHLVTAFNQMTRDLKASYSDQDRRRRFVEIVLKQVTTGVMVVGENGRVRNLNIAALEMLDLTIEEALASDPPRPIRELLAMKGRPEGAWSRVFMELENKNLSLTVNQAALKDEEGQSLGWLVTFDDFSELEKAQRLSAWREVARRIAHEIKNPLTPISLAAQRLRRKFKDTLSESDPDGIFDECTSVIIRQVESMRELVNEFSQFARLPEIKTRPADFQKVVEEILALFRQAHPGLTFSLEVKKKPETFAFDPEQIGRVVTNLLSNAVAATDGLGQVELLVDVDDLAGVSLSVADDGPGLPHQIRERIFEPYVTTKNGGQGLGLAIVKTIITDHGGFVRVYENQPKGTIFTFSIPYSRPKGTSEPK